MHCRSTPLRVSCLQEWFQSGEKLARAETYHLTGKTPAIQGREILLKGNYLKSPLADQKGLYVPLWHHPNPKTYHRHIDGECKSGSAAVSPCRLPSQLPLLLGQLTWDFRRTHNGLLAAARLLCISHWPSVRLGGVESRKCILYPDKD